MCVLLLVLVLVALERTSSLMFLSDKSRNSVRHFISFSPMLLLWLFDMYTVSGKEWRTSRFWNRLRGQTYWGWVRKWAPTKVQNILCWKLKCSEVESVKTISVVSPVAVALAHFVTTDCGTSYDLENFVSRIQHSCVPVILFMITYCAECGKNRSRTKCDISQKHLDISVQLFPVICKLLFAVIEV